MRDKYYYICMETCMIIVLGIDSIQRVIDPTWIRFLFFVNEQSRDAIFNSRVMKRKCLHGGSLKYATTTRTLRRDRLQKRSLYQ